MRGSLRLAGWCFRAILLLLLLAALNTGTNLLYIIFGGVLSFVGISFVLARWTMRGLALSREAPHAVHRGESFLAGVLIENHKRIMPAMSLRVESVAEPDSVLDVQRRADAYVMRIRPRRAAKTSVVLRFERRGVYRLPPLDLASDFPFGLFEERRRFQDGAEVIVYPRVRSVRTSVLDHAAGQRYAARVASSGGDEFFGLREYMPGDDVRRIAWRVSARAGMWMVREMALDNSRHVVFIVDTRWNPSVEEFNEHLEEAVELVASLAVTLLHRQYNVSIITPDGALPSGEGTHQERKVLEMLARVEAVMAEAYPDFDLAMRAGGEHQARVVCISPDPAQWGALAGRESRRVVDPREVIHA